MPVAFDHIAMATHRIADAPAFLVGALGGQSGFGGPSGPYRWWHWDYAGGGRLEVLEPDGPPGGFVHRFLQRNGPGIHHVTFKVPSLQASCARASEHGYEIVGYNDANTHWREAFLHPKQAMGIVVQMVESQPREGDHEHHRAERAFSEPSSPPPPVRVVGLRLRTGDRERARRQWGEVLGAETIEGPDELLFTWPGSGMRIAVAVERGASDCSEAIEISAERPVPLPEGEHPLLGTEFRFLPHETA